MAKAALLTAMRRPQAGLKTAALKSKLTTDFSAGLSLFLNLNHHLCFRLFLSAVTPA
jgi:hypothetical protein